MASVPLTGNVAMVSPNWLLTAMVARSSTVLNLTCTALVVGFGYKPVIVGAAVLLVFASVVSAVALSGVVFCVLSRCAIRGVAAEQ